MIFIKTKKLSLTIFLFSIFIISSGCDDNSHMGNVEITGGKEKIEYIALHNSENGSLLNDTNKLFSFAFEGNNSKNIKYLKNGDEVSLDFGSNPPEELSIKDGLLNSDGDYLYTSKEIIEVPYTKKKGTYSIKLQSHPASLLSSYYKENKTVYRGFTVDAYWGEIEYKYAFVIESDAF